MTAVLYVYAIARQAVSPAAEAIDQSRTFTSVRAGGVAATCTPVSSEEFSQEAVDRRAGDLEWLGAIGYRHQAVVAELMKSTTIVPLRAFTLFSSEEALRQYLEENGAMLSRLLDRLEGKQEWTLRIEFEPQKWSEAIVSRVDSLRDIVGQIEAAGAGKAFLLKKKLEEERRRASRSAEQQVVSEIERAVLDKLSCQTVAESREQREGAFPQINLLINRDEEAVLADLHAQLSDRYAGDGIVLAISGPWPPYTFAALADHA